MSGSLRDALAAKRVREVVYLLAVEDDAEPRKRRDEAKARRLMAGIGKAEDDETVARLQAELDQAQGDLDACYFPLRLRGLSRADLEAVRAACPPPPEAPEDVDFDADAFRPALIAACAVDSDLSAEEWAAELDSDRWSHGDVLALYEAALSVCRRPVNEGAGKG